jgi:ethylbenzene dioxygenase beta subunit
VSDTGEVARFLYEEAYLLDHGEYEVWLQLFSDDACYWVPSHPEQKDPLNEISLYYEDRALMLARIGRLRHPQVLGPPVRTSHVIGNVRVMGRSDGGDLVVHSRFQMIEFVAEVQRLYGGEVVHHLLDDGDGWRIRLKRIDLVNAGGVFELLQGFF